MARHKNVDWFFEDKLCSWEEVQVAVMMDIRDELKFLNGSMNSIKHFFHNLGTEHCRVIVQEQFFRTSRRRRDRLAFKKKQRRRGERQTI